MLKAHPDRERGTMTTTASAVTMETIRDAGPYKHLKFQDQHFSWELISAPGMLVFRSSAGAAHLFANGAEDVAGAIEFTEADPVYWAETTSASTRVWDERQFRSWITDEAADEGLEDDEVEEFFDENDLYTEMFAREAFARSPLSEVIDLPSDPDAFHVWDPYFLQALRRTYEGLAIYRQHVGLSDPRRTGAMEGLAALIEAHADQEENLAAADLMRGVANVARSLAP
jgi:hypothetical protein